MSVGQNVTRGTFNTGTNCSVVLIDNDSNQPIDLGLVTEFTFDPVQNTVESKPIMNKGYNQFVEEYSGYTGTIQIDRRNGSLQAVQFANEASYHNNGGQKLYTIEATVQNVNYDGSTDVYQFTFATIKVTGGRFAKDSPVPISITFRAQDCVPL